METAVEEKKDVLGKDEGNESKKTSSEDEEIVYTGDIEKIESREAREYAKHAEERFKDPDRIQGIETDELKHELQKLHDLRRGSEKDPEAQKILSALNLTVFNELYDRGEHGWIVRQFLSDEKSEEKVSEEALPPQNEEVKNQVQEIENKVKDYAIKQINTEALKQELQKLAMLREKSAGDLQLEKSIASLSLLLHNELYDRGEKNWLTVHAASAESTQKEVEIVQEEAKPEVVVPEEEAKKRAVFQIKAQVLANPELTDDERKKLARDLLWEKEISSEQVEAIIQAHYVGLGETGLDGTEAKIGNYTPAQLREKAEILKKVGITTVERRMLMEAGITGLAEVQADLGRITDREIIQDVERFLRRYNSGLVDENAGLEVVNRVEDKTSAGHAVAGEEATNRELIEDIEEYLSEQRIAKREDKKEAIKEAGARGIDPHAYAFLREITRDECILQAKGDLGLSGSDLPTPEVFARANKIFEDRAAEEQQKLLETAAKDPYGLPGSVQEVVSMIIATEGETIWGQGGRYPLLHKKGDRDENNKDIEGQLHQGNFRRWVRQKAMAQINFSPDNPSLDLASAVGIERSLRQYNIIQMFFNPGAFFYDKVKNEVHSDLAETVVLEVPWLRSKAHQNSAIYRNAMPQESELPKALSQIYSTNDFTKAGSLELILNLPSADIDRHKTDKDLTGEKNTAVGDAIRAAYLTYYYISDKTMLDQMYSQDAVLFNNSTFRDKFIENKKRERKDKRRKEVIKAQKIRGPFPKAEEDALELEADDKIKGEYGKLSEESNKFFTESGQVIPGRESAWMNYLNIFNNPDKTLYAIKDVKERIRISLMEKFDLDYDEAEYAEYWAYSLIHWTGGAARNETEAIGHDSWSKIQNMMEHRLRQAQGQRMGVFGNPYNVYGFKRMGPDFMSGTLESTERREGKRTILEIFQGGQGSHIDLTKKTGTIVFGENTQRQFDANVIQHDFKLFSYIGEGKSTGFDQFVQIDLLGRITFDEEKANEWKDGLVKSFRYPLATWPHLDFSKRERVWVTLRDKHGKPRKDANGITMREEKEVSMAEAMFGREILDKKKYHKMIDKRYKKGQVLSKDEIDELNKKGKVILDNGGRVVEVLLHDLKLRKKYGHVVKDKTGKAEIDSFAIQNDRTFFWKEALKEEIAAQISYHRRREGRGRRYTMEEIERIYAYLGSIGDSLVGNEKDMGEAEEAGSALSAEDIAWIRKKSKTQMWRMFVQDSFPILVAGGFGGFWNLLKQMAKEAMASGK